jgi:hypothetical protein
MRYFPFDTSAKMYKNQGQSRPIRRLGAACTRSADDQPPINYHRGAWPGLAGRAPGARGVRCLVEREVRGGGPTPPGASKIGPRRNAPPIRESSHSSSPRRKTGGMLAASASKKYYKSPGKIAARRLRRIGKRGFRRPASKRKNDDCRNIH